jgi:hypothetical protein
LVGNLIKFIEILKHKEEEVAQVKAVCQNCNTPGTFEVNITDGTSSGRCKRCYKWVPILLKGGLVMVVEKPKVEKVEEVKEEKVKEEKKPKEGKPAEDRRPKDGKAKGEKK